MSILSVDQLSRCDFEKMFSRADEIPTDKVAKSSLSGLIIAMLFFQASTRTRLSFESAALRLGAQCIGFAEPGSARAGPGWKESIADTARMLNSYAHASVIRHYERGAASEYANHSTIPVINAGDGCGSGAEHPTQAILDLYTLRHSFGSVDKLRVLLVGDLRQRTPNSLIKALAKFDSVKVYLLPAPGYEISELALSHARASGISIESVSDYQDVVSEVDAIYLCGMEDPKESSPLNHVLSTAVLRQLRQDAVIMHPLPRGNELPREVDSYPQSAYFRQAAFGVPIRMAILENVFAPNV